MDLNFNSALGRVSRYMESRDRLFEFEPMGDQGLEVDETAGDETDGFRVLIRISILKLDINLISTQVHKREHLFVPADTDDEHFTTKLD